MRIDQSLSSLAGEGYFVGYLCERHHFLERREPLTSSKDQS